MNSKLLTCMEDGVERLEYVLEQVSSEINAVQDKIDDIKIEVLENVKLHVTRKRVKLLHS